MKTNVKNFTALSLLLLFYGISFAQNQNVQNILNDVKIDSMTFFVKQLTGEEPVIIGGNPDIIISRHKNHPGNEKAFQFIKEKFQSYGLQADSLQFSSTGKNLFGIKEGMLYPDKKFIIGAHYDNVAGVPGADDNASGTAAVLEAARVFSEYDFPYTIIFALWDEEEQGLIGSDAYASSAAASNENILGYINMDMLGWDGNNDNVADIHVRPVASSLALLDKAMVANIDYDIGLSLHLVNPGISATDHASFWNNGFSAIGINEEYDGDFNPFWHTPNDTLGQFNIPFYEKCAKLVFATLGECAFSSTLGLNNITEQNKVNVYPNPASNTIYIDAMETIESVVVYNTLGVQIDNISLGDMSRVDTSSLSDGLYFFHIQTRNATYSPKKIIQH